MSDTPRTDATQHQWTRTLELARTLEREGNLLRAEVERLRAALGVYIGEGPDHIYAGYCADSFMWHSRDPDCPACALLSAALQEPTP